MRARFSTRATWLLLAITAAASACGAPAPSPSHRATFPLRAYPVLPDRSTRSGDAPGVRVDLSGYLVDLVDPVHAGMTLAAHTMLVTWPDLERVAARVDLSHPGDDGDQFLEDLLVRIVPDVPLTPGRGYAISVSRFDDSVVAAGAGWVSHQGAWYARFTG